MTNNDTMPAEPDTLTEYEFTRSNSTAKNLQTLRAIACSIIKRDNSLFHEVNRKRWELTDEIQRMKELVENIALGVSKTYAERGDSYQLPDDVALMRIRDLLLQHDPSIINSSVEREARRVNAHLRLQQIKRTIQRQR